MVKPTFQEMVTAVAAAIGELHTDKISDDAAYAIIRRINEAIVLTEGRKLVYTNRLAFLKRLRKRVRSYLKKRRAR